ncbi:MAG: beta-galactosidase [Planctomycetota bacterium]
MMHTLRDLSILTLVFVLAFGTHADEPLIIQDFSDPAVMDRIRTNDTTATLGEGPNGPRLEVVSGTTSPYPNVRWRPPGKNSAVWDLSKYTHIEVDVTNLDDKGVRLIARVDSPPKGKGRESIGGKITLGPKESGTIVVEIDREFAAELRAKLEGMKGTPWGRRGSHGDGIDPTRVREMQVFLATPKQSFRFAVDEVRATGRFDPSSLTIPEPFFPFIDTYGQYIHADWPGKVQSDADLKHAAEQEASDVRESPRPDSWNKWGGWADGPQLEATGHFRTEKVDGRWHLVDPDGRLFFSLGVSVVHGPAARGGTPIDQGRDSWFVDPPWESGDPAMQAFLGEAKVRRFDYAKRTVQTFGFSRANLLRKYGEDWEQQWYRITPARLMNWGLNTIGCWSDPKLFEDTSIPYTHWVYINAPKLPWQRGTRNRVSDPFNPGFEPELRRRITNMTRGTIDDPWCIGYFLDNELSWGEEDHLARGLLTAKPNQAAKQRMFAFLQEKYGDIAKLNAAWGVSYAGWDDAVKGESDPQTDAAHADLVEFNAQIVHAYFSTVRRVFKEIAPDKLYLGCRFAHYNKQVARIAAEYCDVVSFNVYRHTLSGWTPMADFDKPIVIGEFHFGASDRGVFNRGLVRADSTEHKAELFKGYVASAVDNPLVVGVHWFQFRDQTATGRSSDGENHGIGFLSVTDTPHDAMIDASREMAGRLYGGPSE